MAATCAGLGLFPAGGVALGVAAGVVEVPVALAELVLVVAVGVALGPEALALVVAVGVAAALVELGFVVGVLFLFAVLALVVAAVVVVAVGDTCVPLLRVSCTVQAASGRANARITANMGAFPSRDLIQDQAPKKFLIKLIFISGS